MSKNERQLLKKIEVAAGEAFARVEVNTNEVHPTPAHSTPMAHLDSAGDTDATRHVQAVDQASVPGYGDCHARSGASCLSLVSRLQG